MTAGCPTRSRSVTILPSASSSWKAGNGLTLRRSTWRSRGRPLRLRLQERQPRPRRDGRVQCLRYRARRQLESPRRCRIGSCPTLDRELRNCGSVAPVGERAENDLEVRRSRGKVGERPHRLLPQQGVAAPGEGMQRRVEAAPREPCERSDCEGVRKSVSRFHGQARLFVIGRTAGWAARSAREAPRAGDRGRDRNRGRRGPREIWTSHGPLTAGGDPGRERV